MARWRKKVKSYNTSYAVQKEAIQWVLKYFYQYDVKSLFIKGCMSYWVVNDTIKIEYKKADWSVIFFEFVVVLLNRRRSDELRILVQDFVVDTFFLYEWEWQPLKSSEIATLFGVTSPSIDRILRTAKEKLLEHKDLLWE